MKEIYTIYLDNVYNLSASFIMWWLIYGANEIKLYIWYKSFIYYIVMSIDIRNKRYIESKIYYTMNQLEKLEAAKAAWLVCLSLLGLTGPYWVLLNLN